MEDLLSKISDNYQRGLPFVAYALPESSTIVALLQKDARVYESSNFAEEGFVFAPFSDGRTLLIPAVKSEMLRASLSDKITPVTVSSEENNSEKETYIKLVGVAVDYISNGEAQKIVTSRREEVKLKTFEFSAVVSRLFALYPGAFRYIWHHPESGTWCGATPEILIETQGKKFNTMALAGTRTYVENTRAKWTPKELNEQQMVVDAITTRLEPLVSILKVSNTKDYRAGSLVHLRTDFQGILDKSKSGLECLVRALHPTPAVCGTPQEVAKNFILANENYDRTYYTGFLGPIHADKDVSRLFVNLRCMKIIGHSAYLYVGGGITVDSLAEAEWDETQNKLQTMLQVLSPWL